MALTRTQLCDLIRRMRNVGLPLEDIANEVRIRAGCSILTAYRLANQFSQHQVVDAYERITRSTIDQPMLSRLEQFPHQGGRMPTASQLIGLAKVYGTSPQRLLNLEGVEQLAEHDRSIIKEYGQPIENRETAPRAAAIHYSNLQKNGQAQAPKCQDLDTTIFTAGHRALQFSLAASGTNVADETLDELTDEVQRLALAYQLSPIHLVLDDLVRVQDATFRLLEGRQKPADTQRLYSLAAMASGLLANACHDVGKNSIAMNHTRAAYVCADNADDDGLRAWVRGLQSMISYWAGKPHDALKFVDAGTIAAKRWSGSSAPWLACLRARAWGQLGNLDGAIDAIRDSMAAREAVQPNDLDDLGGKFTFPLPRQLYYAADASAWFGERANETGHLAEDALRAYGSLPTENRSFVDESVARTDVALSYLRRMDVEGAADALRPVLDLSPGERVGGVLVNSNRIATALDDSNLRSPASRDLREAILLFNATTAAEIAI